jgi:hypothetical protein
MVIHRKGLCVMTNRLPVAAAFLALTLATPALSQSAPPRAEGAIAVAQADTSKEDAATARRSRKRSSASKKEPTAGQMMARERQKKCAAEWKEAKAAGKTQGLKWPKFWSQCNARLKGNSA